MTAVVIVAVVIVAVVAAGLSSSDKHYDRDYAGRTRMSGFRCGRKLIV